MHEDMVCVGIVQEAKEDKARSKIVVNECATSSTFLMFLITSTNTLVHAAFAVTKDNVNPYFYVWVVVPISAAAMAISFVLKTRRKGWYNVFLYIC